MSRRFRLQTLERLRRSGLDDAARDLTVARQAVAAAIGHRDALVDELAGCVAAADATPAEHTSAQARRTVLREKVDEAGREVTAARERAAAAVAAWTAARGRLRVVEMLHERHRETVRAEEARREQRLVDDLAGTRRRLLGADAADAADGTFDPFADTLHVLDDQQEEVA